MKSINIAVVYNNSETSMTSLDIFAIQTALARYHFDGWLFYDFQYRDPIAYRILQLPTVHPSRRWYYYIPTHGIPTKIVSRVEPHMLDAVPGNLIYYLSWEDQQNALRNLFQNHPRVAMHYSPMNEVPYVSIIDAGTIELIRSFGVEVVSAQDLIQQFEGLVSPELYQTHIDLGIIMQQIMDAAFTHIKECLHTGKKCTESSVQRFMLDLFTYYHLTNGGSGPIVAVNEHAADPHYDLSQGRRVIQSGDLVLIDSWAKFANRPSVYYDHTWMAYIGSEIPPRIQEIWKIVKSARDTAITFERDKISHGLPCYGWEVDRQGRQVIESHGFGANFLHRLGHSIGSEVHGNAVHLDNLETHETRQLEPFVLHSVEPGIYLPEEKIGIRSEIDVYITSNREVQITGPVQEEIIRIL